MRIKVTKDYDLHIVVSKSGTPRATVAFKASDEPITVKREWGEKLVADGAAVEVKETAKRPQNDPAVMNALRAAVGADSDGE